MDSIRVRALEDRKAVYVREHGPLHPKLETLPPEVQLQLLEQAAEGDVELSASVIEGQLRDLDARVEVVRQAASLLRGAHHA